MKLKALQEAVVSEMLSRLRPLFESAFLRVVRFQVSHFKTKTESQSNFSPIHTHSSLPPVNRKKQEISTRRQVYRIGVILLLLNQNSYLCKEESVNDVEEESLSLSSH
jgi:hypothetical protein